VKLQGVIFDFDGVLADSEPLHLRALQAALAARGITLGAREYYSTLLGYDDEASLEVLARSRSITLDAEKRKGILADKAARFAALQAEGDPIFPGAVELVKRLGAAVPLAIASGARREEIERTLTHAGLASAFVVIIAAGSTPQGKPAPDPYIRAAELLGVDPSSSAAIEDSRWGLESAKGAGLKAVGVTHSYPAHELQPHADLVVTTLDEITLPVLEELLR
jgi:beta-phosphoglucomutase